MTTPFPGMDPYLEHPILWTGFHSGLTHAISQQLALALRPRYVASIEERVMIDIPQHQRIPDWWVQKVSDTATTAQAAVAMEEPLVMEISSDPVKEHFIEILDRYQDLKVVTVIEVVSPINKAAGPGLPRRLRNRLPNFGIPLVAPDPDVPLDLQAALARVYEDGSYMLRVHYERPCSPPLQEQEQQWAWEQWADYKSKHSELFG